jgi:hypothetical protein
VNLDLDCAVCGQSAALTDLTPIAFEHATEVWARVHEHTAPERKTWYEIAIREDEE